MSLNACVLSDEHLEYWRERAKGRSRTTGRRFLPERVFLRVNHGGEIDVRESDDGNPPGLNETEYLIRASALAMLEKTYSANHTVHCLVGRGKCSSRRERSRPLGCLCEW